VANEMAGMTATTKEVVKDGKSEWVNPHVYVSGKLRYSKGRMGREYGEKEWEPLRDAMGYSEKV
jgi:hypothetical protein